MISNPSRFTLNELRYVVALAEEGHFGRAAARCHVSQPTLSAQLKKLERALGVRLFERTNRRVAATHVGDEIVAQARRVLEEADKIGELAGRYEGPLCGPLRLGVIPTVGPYLLPPLVPALHQAFPRLQLVLREDLTANLTQRLKKHGLDAVLCALPVAEPGLVYEPLFDEPFWVIMPPRHPLADKADIAEGDLAGEHLLLLDEGHCLRDQALAVCGREPGSAEGDDFRAASLETVREMVGAGLGLVYEPLFDEPFWVIMAPRHPLADKAEIAEGDLAGEHLLLLDEGHCLRDQALAVCGREPGTAEGDDFRAASLETVREMVGAGLGLSLLPALAVGNQAPAKLRLEVRPFGAPSPKRRIGLVWRRGYPRADGLMMLADVVRRHLPEGVKPVARRAAA